MPLPQPPLAGTPFRLFAEAVEFWTVTGSETSVSLGSGTLDCRICSTMLGICRFMSDGDCIRGLALRVEGLGIVRLIWFIDVDNFV